MPAIQTTYNSRLSDGVLGMIADASPLADVFSREVETAGGIPFGRAVVQGTADRQCKLGAAGVFLGITARDNTLAVTNGDQYAQNNTAAVLQKGVIWVLAGEAVNAGDAVYRTPTGTLNKTASGNTLIPNARWETTAANGALAKLRLY